MQSLKYFLPTLILATASFEACAQGDDKFFVEAYAGAISADFGSDFANDFTLVGTRFGYNFTSMLSVEADLSSGTNTQSQSFGVVILDDPQNPVVVERRSDNKIESIFGVFGKATLPVNERFSAYARLGLAEVREEFALSS
ncbi:MAG: outer membrane beta-barrel protein [Pseudomonadota bacterium]